MRGWGSGDNATIVLWLQSPRGPGLHRGQAGLGWRLQLLARPPAASVSSAGGRGDRSSCPGDATSAESPEAHEANMPSCLQTAKIPFYGRPGHSCTVEELCVHSFTHSLIHPFNLYSFNIYPTPSIILPDEMDSQCLRERHTLSHVRLRVADFIIVFNTHKVQGVLLISDVPRCLSRVRLFVILWTIAHQAPLSLGVSRQELKWVAISSSKHQMRGPNSWDGTVPTSLGDVWPWVDPFTSMTYITVGDINYLF